MDNNNKQKPEQWKKKEKEKENTPQCDPNYIFRLQYRSIVSTKGQQVTVWSLILGLKYYSLVLVATVSNTVSTFPRHTNFTGRIKRLSVAS